MLGLVSLMCLEILNAKMLISYIVKRYVNELVISTLGHFTPSCDWTVFLYNLAVPEVSNSINNRKQEIRSLGTVSLPGIGGVFGGRSEVLEGIRICQGDGFWCLQA